MTEINNFTSKPINEFTNQDTLYFQKNINGYRYTFFVEFVKFEKGMITGKILDIQPNNINYITIKNIYYKKGSEISNRISNSYTFEKSRGCHWFKKEDIGWICR